MNWKEKDIKPSSAIKVFKAIKHADECMEIMSMIESKITECDFKVEYHNDLFNSDPRCIVLSVPVYIKEAVSIFLRKAYRNNWWADIEIIPCLSADFISTDSSHLSLTSFSVIRMYF